MTALTPATLALDKFTQRALKKVFARWDAGTKEYARTTRLLRAAILCEFSDREIAVLHRAGYLSVLDCQSLAACGRRDPREVRHAN